MNTHVSAVVTAVAVSLRVIGTDSVPVRRVASLLRHWALTKQRTRYIGFGTTCDNRLDATMVDGELAGFRDTYRSRCEHNSSANTIASKQSVRSVDCEHML